MKKETLKSLQDIELIIPAEKVYQALLKSVDGDKVKEFTPERFKELKLLCALQNSLISAFREKKGYFKLIADYRGRVKFFEAYHKKHK